MSYSLSSVYPNTDVVNLPITYFPLNIISPDAILHPPRPFNDKTGYDTGMNKIIMVLLNSSYACM